MKKILVTMMALALTIAAQAEKIDSTQFVAFYNYTIQTQDEEDSLVHRGNTLVGWPMEVAWPAWADCKSRRQRERSLFHALRNKERGEGHQYDW